MLVNNSLNMSIIYFSGFSFPYLFRLFLFVPLAPSLIWYFVTAMAAALTWHNFKSVEMKHFIKWNAHNFSLQAMLTAGNSNREIIGFPSPGNHIWTLRVFDCGIGTDFQAKPDADEKKSTGVESIRLFRHLICFVLTQNQWLSQSVSHVMDSMNRFSLNRSVNTKPHSSKRSLITSPANH